VFESYVNQQPSQDKTLSWRRMTFIVSFALHGVLLSAATVHSFWQVDELSPPAVQVTFISALAPPPPPPPPAPAAAPAEKPRPKVKKPLPPETIVQPPVTPPEEPREVAPPAAEPEEEAADEGEPEGQAGGMVGGVAGGVPASVPPPKPVPPPPPVNIAPHVGEAHRLTDLEDVRYRPSLPPSINRPGMMVWGVFRICVAGDGHVSAVSIVKSADPLVDHDWMAKIKGWRYRPYSVDGRPVPFCHPARIVVKSAS
jgi:periplasmic protein TonB